MLVALPDRYKPEHVAPALATKVQTLPEALRRLADLGRGPRDARLEAGPHRRRPRGLLLRPARPVAPRLQREHQWAAAPVLPKGTDFSTVTEAELDAVADELNDRPRKRLGFANPIEHLSELLLQ
jgi:hypothetical protein